MRLDRIQIHLGHEPLSSVHLLTAPVEEAFLFVLRARIFSRRDGHDFLLDEPVGDKPGQLRDLLVFVLELVFQLGDLALVQVVREALLVFLEHALADLLPPYLLDAALFLVLVLVEAFRVVAIVFKLLANLVIGDPAGVVFAS